MCEVEVGTGAVAHVHGLHQAAFRPEAVEDDGVEQNADDLDDDFDDDADEGPILETTYQDVVDLVGVDLGALVVGTCPSPHVFVAAAVLAVLEYHGCDDPEDQTQDELCERVSYISL